MSHAIAVGQVSEFVDSVFGEDLHAKRILSLANAATGVLRAGTLGVNAIGRGLAMARGVRQKHSVKQVDRLLSNEALDVWELFPSWVSFAVADRTEIWVALDWTIFEKDDHATLVASIVSSHGRTTPLVWLSIERGAAIGQQLELEELLLGRLRESLPGTVRRTIIIADRGFGDATRWDAITKLGFEFIVRIRGTLRVADAKGREKAAEEWVGPGGTTRTLKGAVVTGEQVPVAQFVAVRKAEMKASWCLVTSLSDVTGGQIINAYGRRFTIEESFRDIKDLRFGMGLAEIRTSSLQRRDRLLLLSALAIALLTLLGAAGETVGIDRHFKTNTAKRRQFSLFRQGCDYYEYLPVMRDEWAIPLITKFSELLESHRIFQKTLGFI